MFDFLVLKEYQIVSASASTLFVLLLESIQTETPDLRVVVTTISFGAGPGLAANHVLKSVSVSFKRCPDRVSRYRFYFALYSSRSFVPKDLPYLAIKYCLCRAACRGFCPSSTPSWCPAAYSSTFCLHAKARIARVSTGLFFLYSALSASYAVFTSLITFLALAFRARSSFSASFCFLRAKISAFLIHTQIAS